MKLNTYRSIRLIALSWAIAVLLGALGAHFLKSQLSPESLDSFHVGLRYHFYFNIASLLIILIGKQLEIKRISLILSIMSVGTILFSGSIYLLSTKELTGLTVSVLGPVTPLGGLLIIMSWLMLFFNLKVKK